MLVEGTCANGHKFMCSVYEGRVAAVQANGRIRDTCPECGGKPYVVSKSGTMAFVRETAPGPAPAARTGTGRSNK